MAFRFRFQSVLNYRKRLVEERQMALALAQQRLLQLRQEIQELRERREALAARIQAELSGSLQVAQVRVHYAYLDWLDARLRELEQALEAAERSVEEQRRALEEALKRRKTLEKLREKDRRVFVEELERRERLILDDLGVARHRRLRLRSR